jgi:hypothetical protein
MQHSEVERNGIAQAKMGTLFAWRLRVSQITKCCGERKILSQICAKAKLRFEKNYLALHRAPALSENAPIPRALRHDDMRTSWHT